MKFKNIALFAASLWVFTACGGSKSDTKSVAAVPVTQAPAADTAAGLDDDGDSKTVSVNGLYAVEVVWSANLMAGTLENSAVVHFHDPKTGAHVPAVLKSFRLYHTTMGHGSIKTGSMTFAELDTGHWSVGNIYFSMPGAASSWAVDIEADVLGQTDKVRVFINDEVM